MINTIEFEVVLLRKAITKKELAKRLHISDMALYRKINNLSEFKLSEIVAIQHILKLDDFQRDAIFLQLNITGNQHRR